MIVCQILSRIYHSVHVSLHQIRDYVYIFKASRCRWLLHIDECYDVIVLEEFYNSLHEVISYLGA